MEISTILKDVSKDISDKSVATDCMFVKRYDCTLFGERVIVEEIIKDEWNINDIQSMFKILSIVREKGCNHIVQPMGYITKDKLLNIYGIVHQKFVCNLEEFLFQREKTFFKNVVLTVSLKYNIAIQCAESLYIFHSLGFTHKRIELKSFYLDKNMNIFLGDYYFSANKNYPLMNGHNTGKEGDVFGLAFIVYQLFNETQCDINAVNLPILPRLYMKQELCGLHGEEKKLKRERIVKEDIYAKLSCNISHQLENLLLDTWNSYNLDRLTANEFLNRINDCSLVTECGGFWEADFWVYCTRENGCLPEKVLNFENMASNIATSVDIPISLVNQSGIILSKNNEITSDAFGYFINNFGKFYVDNNIMSDLIQFASSDYYFDISKDEAQTYLNNKVDLTFLIRPSNTNPKFPFTISKRVKSKTVHTRIERRENSFYCTMSGKEYKAKSIPSLVDMLRNDGLIKESCPKELNDDIY
ncbi:SH2 domain containing protein [Entamoeba histolytica HM-1:IMSS-B]|uniref:SH2 domain containing protein n=5 Tax=Entamoeba histolytica TaxID=5759 RepID=C4LTF1_ENTH1|nr:SH2 domain containing protein [Entamoeba histolytica HM-1:IMSS]EMH77625.1 SH2 domain containing protein [Entamoeba histolytica HM-1:IMSS-B]EMS12238.1 SH2 domain containing protein [Entamoeba histolytica HM-3:IMSS]ENY65059.1 SH2 domain containing protein [Entamoeba histolytica HM-1:IMSS-A]GAT91837.1 sh2 domain containing protein [Entamoeba histolytica]EAL48191.1 SH2 domain containing protein [Entamoeba histolytica HM-1:IMSS]|eukprot:XP_653577.1 SH2 domain containing protein [Entamoeba histolytica HM-1:IMSS]